MDKTSLLDNIVEHTDDGVLVIDKEGVILAANTPATRILGFAEKDLVGQSYSWIFFHETQNQPLSQIINEGLKKQIEHHLSEIQYQLNDNKSVRMQVSTSLVSQKDSIGKLFKKESLVIFFKPIEETEEQAALATDSAEIDRLKEELETLKYKNTTLSKLSGRFEWIKLGLAGFTFLLFLIVILYSRNKINVFPDKTNAKELKQVEQQVVPVTMDSMEMKIYLSGQIEPHHKVTIAAQTSGKVVKRNFDEGEYVPKNYILYQMDTKELAKNVRSARVKYMELLEEYNRLKDWTESLEVKQAERSFELSKIALRNEKKKLEETRKLFEKGIIPRVEYEQAETAYKKAQYNFENAKQTLEAKLEKGNEEKVQILLLKLSNAKEELDEIEARYEATLIRAPVAGIVLLPEKEDGTTENFKNEGEMVNDGDLVATIGATESFIINSYIGELNVNYLQDGQTVNVRFPGLKGISLNGKVDWVASNVTLENGQRHYPVRMVISNVKDQIRKKIRLGMLVEASVSVAKYDSVITVPINAVFRQNGNSFVYLVNEDDFVKKSVTVGYSNNNRIIIKEGLKEGDKIVIQSAGIG
jgi:PAS domain S-box-containing protein